MSYEQRDNNGSLFKNDRKAKDSHPDYNGTVMVAGQEYYISAWLKEAKTSGKKFFSLSFNPKGSWGGAAPSSSAAQAPAKEAPAKPAPSDEDVPF